MRLTSEQLRLIEGAAIETFGPSVQVYIFGSRVNDSAKGGDIDIMISLDQPIERPAISAARLATRIERQMNGRKVDVLLKAPSLKHLPIHDVALQAGQRIR